MINPPLILSNSPAVLESSFMGYMFFAFIAFVIYQIQKNNGNFNYIQEDESRFNFRTEFLLLTAHLLKADGDVKERELKFVYWFLEKEYGKSALPANKKLLAKLLSKNYKLGKALKKIDYEQDTATKIQLINYLVKIATIDGFLSTNEVKALTRICRGIDLTGVQLRSILAMHSFITEEQHNRKQKQYQKQKTATPKYRLRSSYTILGIDESATVSEIKRAYRKLVVLYHPDKTRHLSHQFQVEAKDKFQKVNDAYDLLKDKLNFK